MYGDLLDSVYSDPVALFEIMSESREASSFLSLNIIWRINYASLELSW